MRWPDLYRSMRLISGLHISRLHSMLRSLAIVVTQPQNMLLHSCFLLASSISSWRTNATDRECMIVTSLNQWDTTLWQDIYVTLRGTGLSFYVLMARPETHNLRSHPCRDKKYLEARVASQMARTWWAPVFRPPEKGSMKMRLLPICSIRIVIYSAWMLHDVRVVRKWRVTSTVDDVAEEHCRPRGWWTA